MRTAKEDDENIEDEEQTDTETTPFIASTTGQNRAKATRHAHLVKSVLYGIQNFYAFMIM